MTENGPSKINLKKLLKITKKNMVATIHTFKHNGKTKVQDKRLNILP